MRDALLMFFTSLLAIAIGLFAYDEYRKPQAIALASQVDALRTQAEAVAQQAQKLAAQVEDERKRGELERQKYVAASALLEGIGAAGAARNLVAKYYEQNDRWPASNQDAGLPAPEHYTTRALTRLELSRDGVITLTFNDKSGVDGGTVQLVPSSSPALGISWRCVSGSYPDIALALDSCEYEKPEAG